MIWHLISYEGNVEKGRKRKVKYQFGRVNATLSLTLTPIAHKSVTVITSKSSNKASDNILLFCFVSHSNKKNPLQDNYKNHSRLHKSLFPHHSRIPDLTSDLDHSLTPTTLPAWGTRFLPIMPVCHPPECRLIPSLTGRVAKHFFKVSSLSSLEKHSLGRCIRSLAPSLIVLIIFILQPFFSGYVRSW